MAWNLPAGARFVIERLEENGYHADIVGGCVRDLLRGVTPNDYDITTDATPEQMLAVFSDVRTIETGLRHGTLTVLYEHEPYEVTTYRTEGSYTDHRHPDGVHFTHRLSDDLCRRDFTVNAMCYHPTRGITDLYGGQHDLQARLIRCVGDAERRFSEDALRMLRALRFSAVLDFAIDDEASRVIHQNKHLLRAVSAERVYIEIKKLLGGVRAGEVYAAFSDVFEELMPSLVGVPQDAAAWDRLPSASLRFATLFAHASDACARFADACNRLRVENSWRHLGEQLLPYATIPTDDQRDLLILLYKFGQTSTEQLLSLRFALGVDAANKTENVRALLQSGAIYRLCDLAVDGSDMLACGLRGTSVGQALQALLLAVMDGAVPNEREALLSYVQNLKL